ncbi:MAG: non-canonical purine NTP pyrophosphatase [Gemmatimonadetes bacterium]|nr:non-canonical purine NTP pyrophosphatase [Gemmatimonadota bacterium]
MTAPFLIATRSPGKRKEIVQILRDIPYRLVFPEDVGLVERAEEAGLETADSFEGNARRKAEYFARLSGVPTAADDSGLEVFSLGGQPGVRSRRFAIVSGPPDQQDAANNAELLRRLAGAPAPRRRARYRCVIAYFSRPDAIPMTFEGTCLGSIAQAPRGGGGFGYDPLFVSDDLGKTFGEATPEEKHAVSHRGRAFRALAQWLQTHLTG